MSYGIHSSISSRNQVLMALDRTQLQKLLCNKSLNKDRPFCTLKTNSLISKSHGIDLLDIQNQAKKSDF